MKRSLCGSDEDTWSPSKSQFLTYNGAEKPLKGLDGVYVLAKKKSRDGLVHFFQSSGLPGRCQLTLLDHLLAG